jgi:hypothetical protein
VDRKNELIHQVILEATGRKVRLSRYYFQKSMSDLEPPENVDDKDGSDDEEDEDEHT